MRLGLALIVIGMIFMVIGAGSNALPELATVNFGGESGATITGISDLSASFIFIGIVTALLGIYLHMKHR